MSQDPYFADSVDRIVLQLARQDHRTESVFKRRIPIAFFAVLLIVLASAFQPRLAFADTEHGCIPTEEQLEAYEADGSLAERQRFQEALDNDSADSWLIQDALARTQGEALQSVPPVWQSGMPTMGSAKIVLFCVDFPDKQFSEDPKALLEKLVFGGAPDVSFPYESLSAYYDRSSYGKLEITSPLPAGARVFSYTAQHERDFYTFKIDELFDEALSALGDTVDYSQFDGNNDGIIDAIYLHYAGGDTGWGTTWWSNEHIYRGSLVIDNVKPGNLVVLASVGSTARTYEIEGALRTLIHETGHVLGLPDYYSASSQTSPTTERTGILSFDMMMQNTGEHNGFSKWMLGWLDGNAPGDNAHVTRVVANDSGITVKQGNALVKTLDANATETFDLNSFTSTLGVAETGGIIIVSNEDEGIFSEYFFLQYDSFAQNQSVFISNNGNTAPLPSGFRMYHVNAALNDEGTDFRYTNMYGSLYNQLIELVDPDMGKSHSEGSVPQAFDGSFHCMLFKDDRVTPKSFPSSNYGESFGPGFTGLSFTITDSGGLDLPSNEMGSFTLSYSNADKPLPEGFTLTPSSGFQDFNNAGTLVLDASYTPLLAAAPEANPYILVDGQRIPTYTTLDKVNAKLSIKYMAFDSVVQSTSQCELVFPEGALIIGTDKGTPLPSQEMHFPIAPESITEIAQHGNFADHTGTRLQAEWLSNLFSTGDQTVGFFQRKDDGIYLYRIDTSTCQIINSSGIGSSDARIIAFADDPDAASAQELQATSLPGGSVVLHIKQDFRMVSPPTSLVYLIGPDGTVKARSVSQDGTVRYLIASEDAAVLYNPVQNALFAYLCDFTEGPSPHMSEPILVPGYEKLIDLGAGNIAAIRRDSSDNSRVFLDIMEKTLFIEALRSASSLTNPPADLFSQIPLVRSVHIEDCGTVYDVSQGEAGLFVIVGGVNDVSGISLDPLPISLLRIDEDGTLSTQVLQLGKDLGNPLLQAGAGFETLGSFCSSMNTPFAFAQTDFFDNESQQLSSFRFPYGRSGIWVGQSYFFISPIDECGVYFWKTTAFSPKPVPEPPSPVPPEEPGSQKGRGLADTSDKTASTCILVFSLAASSLLAGAYVARRSRLKPEDGSCGILVDESTEKQGDEEGIS